MLKKLLVIASSIIVVLGLIFYLVVYPKFMIITGYAAKNMCSCVFVAKMNEQLIKSNDLNFNLIPLAKTEVDYVKKSVTASVYGLNSKTAYYRENTGCALINNLKEEDIYQDNPNWNLTLHDSLANWFTYIDTVEHLSDKQLNELALVVNEAFEEVDSLKPRKNTRAALVLFKGQLVAERYANGFDKNTRLMGWSMTKSLTASMLALLVEEGRLNLDEPTKIATWQNDERKKITWKQLLQMNSGLRWKEDYAEVTDAVLMLFNSDGIGEFATQIPLEQQPNTHWEYSSGTSNILATAMRGYFDSDESYIRYPYDSLFYKIGAYSMVMETDAKGFFVGSSYSWANARDWAKIGQLYLQNGNWAGEQLLTKDWVEFVQQEAPNAKGNFGSHFWLNKGGRYPDAPTDMYSLEGFQGQRVFILPSKELVIIKLGLTHNRADFDFNSWVKKITEVIE